jgi:starch synthase
MAEPLKILYVTSEMAPLISTGGLADVARALPKALRRRGNDVRVAMPCYRQIPESQKGDPYCLVEADLGAKTEYGALRVATAPDPEIPLYLLEHEGYFGRERPYGTGAYEYDDNAERYCFFCQALLHGIPQTHWKPDIVHCHDWHTAALPVLLRNSWNSHAFWQHMPVLFTIHNLAFQGRYPEAKMTATGLSQDLFHANALEYEGDMSLMKGAIAFSTRINTVSPRYAREIQTMEYGEGLDGMLRTRCEDLSGILNGVDYEVWNPETDPHIPANYSPDRLNGKAACKQALQKETGLREKDIPLFGIVSRLYWQKGHQLVVDALDRFMEADVQMVVLGSGDPALESAFAEAAARYPDKLKVFLDFDIPLSHRIEAGSDFFLMPSRYEPCGLSQLYSMAYGTIPVVRRTGGLADSILNLNPVHRRHQCASGISFVPLTPEALLKSIRRAIALYQDKDAMNRIRRYMMSRDFSWDRSCRAYEDLYREAIAACRN